MNAAGKLFVLAVWIAALAAFLLPDGHAWATPGRTPFLAMLAIHGLEAIAFLPRLRAAGGSLTGHLAQTLLFGFLHVGRLPREAAR